MCLPQFLFYITAFALYERYHSVSSYWFNFLVHYRILASFLEEDHGNTSNSGSKVRFNG